MKLTDAQRRALAKFADGAWHSAYDVQASLATLNALRKRGLLQRQSGLGALFSPRTSIEYRITPAGQEAAQ